jgi:osmoprotectant transport system ATP-binding protein
VIELENLTKSYDGQVVVDGISLSVARGELLFLVGGSGSGKTTTLKMVNRLVSPTAGRVLIGGQDAYQRPAWELRRRMGYVFQQVGLFPHLTVAENVGITPALLGWSKPRIEQRVDELLTLVELDPGDYRERRPAELSGGQQQRVGIARALAAEPEILLLDEPFGALDPLTRDRLQRSFRAIRTELRLTALFVTHDMTEALLLGDRIAVLDAGRLVQIGAPRELVRAPADDYVAGLMEAPRRHAEVLSRIAGEGAGGSGDSP